MMDVVQIAITHPARRASHDVMGDVEMRVADEASHAVTMCGITAPTMKPVIIASEKNNVVIPMIPYIVRSCVRSVRIFRLQWTNGYPQ